jgi:hypothetical protein
MAVKDGWKEMQDGTCIRGTNQGWRRRRKRRKRSSSSSSSLTEDDAFSK